MDPVAVADTVGDGAAAAGGAGGLEAASAASVDVVPQLVPPETYQQ